MKQVILIKKLTSILVGFTILTVLALSGGTANAIGEGQIEGGDIYRVKNVTKNGEFSDTTFADKCETLKYKVRLHNPGPGTVTNVNVKVNLPATASKTNTSTATITAQNAQPSSVSDTATVKISTAQKIDYIDGSTQLLDTHSKFISDLPDGITSGGVNIGSVGVSLNEIKFVQFKAEIDCPQPPEQPPEQPEKPQPEQQPKALPKTGPGAVFATFLGVSSVSALLHRFFTRRQF